MEENFISVAQERKHEPIFSSVVITMLFLMIPTLIGCKIDAREFNGVSIWIKPFKFELSIAIYFVTLSLFTTYLDEKYCSLRIWKWMTWAAALSAFFEIGYIFFRASRGEASHFNESNPLAEVMYALMGIGALIIVLVTLWMGYFILHSKNASLSSHLRLAIGLGLMATAILGGSTGIYVSVGDSHWIGGLQNDAHGLPFLGWSRTGGDLRIAHILGLHTMQVLPLFTLIGLNTRKYIWTALIIWSLLTIFIFFHAVQGRSLF